MTDKEYKAFVRKLKSLKKKWIKILGLEDWDIEVLAVRGRSDNDERLAECNCKWEYRDVSMRFFTDIMDGVSDEEFEQCFVHECCHILLAETREWAPIKMESDVLDKAMKHEERAAVMIERALLAAYKAGMETSG